HPVAVKTVRDAGGNVHGRDGSQRLAIEQHQVAAVAGPVVDETHRDTLVLGGIRGGWDENEFTWLATGPEAGLGGAPGGQIVFEDGIGRSRRAIRVTNRVAVPVVTADQSLVDAGKFLRRVIQTFFGDFPRAEVDGPSVQRRGLGDDAESTVED